MPAYGKKLSPAEVEALVEFMTTLRPRSVPPARNSDKPVDNLPRDFAIISVPAPAQK